MKQHPCYRPPRRGLRSQAAQWFSFMLISVFSRLYLDTRTASGGTGEPPGAGRRGERVGVLRAQGPGNGTLRAVCSGLACAAGRAHTRCMACGGLCCRRCPN